MANTENAEIKETRSGSLERMVRRLRDIACNEGNDGQLLKDAADELERTAAALHWAIRCLESDGNFGAIANVNEIIQGNVPPARAYA